MKIVVGLGNPGKKYEKTRHNVGFLTVDYIQKNIGGFSKWKLNRKLESEISENTERGIIIAKPQTYMNSSGEAVKSIVGSWKLSAEGGSAFGGEVGSYTIVHDDFDLPLGIFKFEFGRGSAGHKGAQSIIDALDTKDFWRMRIGIRPPHPETDIKADAFVLKNFNREEKEVIKKVIPEAIKKLELF
ncbi:aminoacyl-tRNA hydrolase [Candidatus Falkowbacteria bacterium]|nr:aminoacyl-tRNA hydrolase [Candidatus Falkowbacteria bacterium]